VTSTPTIAVLGLGAMGSRAAADLAAEHPVHGYDPDPAARAGAAASDVIIAESMTDAVGAATLIMLSLPTPAVVRAVVGDLDGLDGRLVADLSTIDPGTARSAAALVTGRGGRYVDAPILGRPEGCGEWTLAAGGAEADVAELAEVAVGTIARAVQHVGEVGTGSTLKLLNNLMFGAINTVTAEVMDLAERAGLDPSRFADIIADSGAATVSPLFRSIAPKIAAGTYDPTFSIALLAKDVRLGTELAAAVGGHAPMADLVKMITDRARELGLDDQDTAAVVEVYRRGIPTGTRK
jgi:3-hydroxyisobutyrate dehydrogenase